MKCTICGNQNLELLTKELRNSTGKVYFCSRCDLGFSDKPQLETKEYYDKEYRKKFTDSLQAPDSKPQSMFNLRKEFQEDRLRIVRNYVDKRKKFLEIGCSAGQFLCHILDSFVECVGIELDTECKKFVEESLNIRVYDTELKYCGFQGQPFDYVAAFQVLEHTMDPVGFLNDAKEIIKTDGKIFIEVPNLYDPLLALWDIKAYHQFYYHEAHTHYFSEKSLEKLAQKCGLIIEDIYFLQDYNVLNHVYWYFNNGPQEDCVGGLSKPRIDFPENNTEAGDKVNVLFQEFDQRYKQILSEYKLTSNIFVILSKN